MHGWCCSWLPPNGSAIPRSCVAPPRRPASCHGTRRLPGPRRAVWSPSPRGSSSAIPSCARRCTTRPPRPIGGGRIPPSPARSTPTPTPTVVPGTSAPQQPAHVVYFDAVLAAADLVDDQAWDDSPMRRRNSHVAPARYATLPLTLSLRSWLEVVQGRLGSATSTSQRSRTIGHSPDHTACLAHPLPRGGVARRVSAEPVCGGLSRRSACRLGVVGGALELDGDHRFVADDPCVVAGRDPIHLAGADVALGAVVVDRRGSVRTRQ